jgi:acyl-coenzyme A synthetase/AMP-(fatty) acid ligase
MELGAPSAEYPVANHASLESVVAYRRGRAIRLRRFLADAARLRAMLPEGGAVLNVCEDRYRFMTGFVAALTAGKLTLLPSTHAPESLRQMTEFAPDVFCLGDRAIENMELPFVAYPEDDEAGVEASDVLPSPAPTVECARPAVCVFTSGSTGAPVPHWKTWGSLVKNVLAEAERLGMADGRGYAIVGAAPPQHMYGFESTILLSLLSGAALVADPTFYPLDVLNALNAAPRPRALVTTPFHLRALLAAGLEIPPADLLVSATAPLSPDLVETAEARFGAPLLEIYGCTETGQLASRRPAQTPRWRLFPGVRLTFDETGRAYAGGGHVEARTALHDVLESVDEEHFLLHGRSADLVNIAGKRCSLAYLNHQLNAIPGVEDGAFFMPEEETPGAVTRLAAFAVAPSLDAASLTRALRERINPAFLPRPLLFVERLPRNAAGKLPREALRTLLRRAGEAAGDRAPARHATEREIAEDHPAFAGHFPGHPLLPGALLLDEAVRAVEAAAGAPLSALRIDSAKFVGPARPGETLSIRCETGAEGAASFEILSGERRIAMGRISLGARAVDAAPSGATPP